MSHADASPSDSSVESDEAAWHQVDCRVAVYTHGTEVVLPLQAARDTRTKASTDVLTGIAVNDGASSALDWESRHNSRMESMARQMMSGMGSLALSGRVGDCCDEEEVHFCALHFGLCVCVRTAHTAATMISDTHGAP